ncbi:MAG TPA: hypothetical protein VFD66_05665 [Verrucomicrobiae bacterium]|nr:hypothetical protein [Verrucomicrobiae bacterium]
MKTSASLFHILLAFAAGIITHPLQAQVTLTGTSYAETFDGIASGLPPGWSVRTNATATSLGIPAPFTAMATNWAASSGQFANFASTISNSGTNFTGTEAPTNQAACLNRSLGVRQTGSCGDPGAAFVFQIQNTLGLAGLELTIDCNLLNAQGRSTVWTLDYGIGASPGTFVALDTCQDPGTFGTVRKTVSLGTALDNRSENVWLRIVALNASTGTGSRDTFGIDNFQLNYRAQGVVTPIPLRIEPAAGKVVLTWSNASFGLQAAPSVAGTFTNVPGATSPFTNAVSSDQKFFRLKAN